MKHFLSFVAITALVGCGGSKEETQDQNKTIEKENHYGGVFRMPLESHFTSTRVNELKKFEESQIYWQIFDGLVKYDPKTLDIEPAIAESWSVSADGLTYKFNLRDDVFFHDNTCFENGKGRRVQPSDVKYTFEQVYAKSPNNSAYSVFNHTILGGDEFHEGKVDSIAGIQLGENTVTFTLQEPGLSFIQKLATVFGSIIAPEAFNDDQFLLVGTGPFIFDELNSDSAIVRLARNPKYYTKDENGDQLPYLDSVTFSLYDDVNEQMDEFWNGHLSYIRKVPVNKLSSVLDDKIDDFKNKPPKYILHSEPELATTYLQLNMTTPVLKKKKVRKALNYAINRNKIVDKIIKNQAYGAGQYGITPPLKKSFEEYDFEGIKDVSYSYNPDTARALLAAAGYPNGKNFPTLEMQFRQGGIDYLIASEIQKQLISVLNINIEISAVDFNVMLDNKSKGEADIFRTNWVGDYPTPEAFLANAYGKVIPKSKKHPSFLNTSRYHNKEFDELFEKGAAASDAKEALKYFNQAEKVLMEDAVFIILWYGEDMALEQAALRDYDLNSIGYIDLRSAHFKTPTADEYVDASEDKK